MARKLDPTDLAPASGEVQVRGLDELMDSADFREMMKNEFPEDAAEWLDPVTRRQFVTLMGASLALAGVVGCNPSFRPAPARKVVPYVTKPDAITPGVPLFFATTWTLNGYSSGVLVKSLEGRPLKVEGNPSHPGSLGGTDLYTQGSILNLYDPDRSKTVMHDGTPSTWDAFKAGLFKLMSKLKDTGGTGLRILSETVTSPTLVGLLDEVKKIYPKANWVQYDPVGRDGARVGVKLAFNKPIQPVYKFDEAKRVLALDSDFVTSGPGAVRYARDLASKRKVRVYEGAVDGVGPKEMSRLYSVESMVTGTGAMADHRLPLKPSEIESFARKLAAELGIGNGPKPGPLPKLAEDWVGPLAKDLKDAGGAAVVVPGDHLSASVHALCHAINEKLGAFGKTVTFVESIEVNPGDRQADLKALVGEMKAGKVEALIVLGGNPAYTAPADLAFGDELKKVKATIHLGAQYDETAILCQWHVNEAHYLEAWGDGRAFDGTASLQQPLIAPVDDGKCALEVLAVLLEKALIGPLELVKANWKKHFDTVVKKGSFDLWWDACLEKGVVDGTAAKPATPGTVSLDWVKDAPVLSAGKGLEVVFRLDPTVHDGRFANNGWLQELPKPLTALTWDNAVILSPKTAASDGVKVGWPDFKWTGGEHGRAEVDVVELILGDRKVLAPVWILPGHADDVITVHLGFGREKIGQVGAGVGFNAGAIRTSDAPFVATGATVKKTRDKHFLACVQGQYAMEGRRPSRHGTVEDVEKGLPAYKEDWKAFDFADDPIVSMAEKGLLRRLLPGSPQELNRLGLMTPEESELRHEKHGEHKHDDRLIELTLLSDGPHPQFKTYRRWGMAIDLGACIGCTACVAACVAENNIPVVGKYEVTRGRAMHWIRVDRYFVMPAEDGGTKKIDRSPRQKAALDSASVTTFFQPLPCQQCEKAPCEIVCPVGATVHSTDGLNDMVYNRCVGTRYCSNNCPYKVRRFNFLQYADYATESMKLVNNPEVTVRTRGVMEKCTYCVQRIRSAEVEAEREFDIREKDARDGRPRIKDGEVITACQAACPTGAIVFGDINDPASVVRKWKLEPTNYGLLAELNTMPRTTYLAAVKNPNPAMPKGA
ncbi:MAG TPA: TAT-variant-translocated molybdopterin oxidoreductase [Fimbriiglobus sp.]|jgi:molybdopterin-containing oxidoreductase family iron-sulfur binding subunit